MASMNAKQASIEKDRQLIEQHGGPARLAEKLGYDKVNGGVQRVQNWKARGIPSSEKLDRPDLFWVSGDLGFLPIPTATSATVRGEAGQPTTAKEAA
jgi:hypothetical protein